MLNFDPERYTRIQTGAIALAEDLGGCIHDRMTSGTIDTILFLGTGGAGILMLPAAQLLQTQSEITSYVLNTAELVQSGCRRLGPTSLVIAPSLSGTTTETEEALHFCRSKGAATIALTGHDDTPVGRAAENVFVNFAEDDTSSESFYLQSLLIALAVMRERGELADYDDVLEQLKSMPSALLHVKEQAEPEAPALAKAIAEGEYHIISSAGNAWAEALYYGMCILEEMQWIRTRPVHSSDFFHGPLELVDASVSVLLLKGEDGGRPLVERVERFARQHTDRLQVIDTADYDLPGVSRSIRALVAPAILAAVLERVSAHLEVLTGHPLTMRRYYRKVSY